jgi:GNAT superfamily N-acetyltransferase
VECRGDGDIQIFRSENRVSKPISFADELKIREGTLADWKYFARWHYRSRTVAFVRRVVVLEHLHQPIGICIFCCPAASLTLRTRYFGLQRPQSPRMMQRMNKSLWVLSRVVLHPTYRGAGIAARFIAEACDSCPVEWIETLSAMGRVNPVFEKAGFQKIGLIRRNGKRPSRAYKNRKSNKNPNEDRHNQFSEPVYFIRKTFRGPTRG